MTGPDDYLGDMNKRLNGDDDLDFEQTDMDILSTLSEQRAAEGRDRIARITVKDEGWVSVRGIQVESTGAVFVAQMQDVLLCLFRGPAVGISPGLCTRDEVAHPARRARLGLLAQVNVEVRDALT